MIKALLEFDADGLLRVIRLDGHAGLGKKGSDPLCAAVSYAARTLYRTLSLEPEILLDYRFPEEGSFYLKVKALKPQVKSWFQGVSAGFLTGLGDLQIEFPQQIQIDSNQREE